MQMINQCLSIFYSFQKRGCKETKIAFYISRVYPGEYDMSRYGLFCRWNYCNTKTHQVACSISINLYASYRFDYFCRRYKKLIVFQTGKTHLYATNWLHTDISLTSKQTWKCFSTFLVGWMFQIERYTTISNKPT